MELRQLEQFIAVAEEGQFTRAAIRCTIAQSALSTSIRSLERELGAPLFVRTTRRVELTQAGIALLPEARHTVAAAAAAHAAVQEVQGLLRGSLSVGGVPTFSLLDQPDLLRRFRAEHPGVEIRYQRGASPTLIEEVRDGRLDVAFVSLPGSPPADLRVIEITAAPAMLVCRPDHRLAGHRAVSFDELAKETFVGAPVGSMGYQAIDRVFIAAGTERRVPYEVNDVTTALDFVECGLGVTLMVEAVAASRPSLRAVPLADSTMRWAIGAVTQPAERLGPAARALLDLLPPSGSRA